ncbi:MAG: hypothetical protein ACTSR8_14675 [Promethearchaeota archaeon]
MKKISYALNWGLVGNKDSRKDVFIKYIKRRAKEASFISDVMKNLDFYEFLIVFKEVPIKLRVFIAENLDQLIYNYDKITNLEVILLCINIYNFDSLDKYNLKKLEELNEYFMFRGLTTLIGIDVKKIFNKDIPNFKLSRRELVQKAKELNVLYCFEIQNMDGDIDQLFDKILDDYIFKFQVSSPEIFESAKLYGKELLK